MASNDYRLERWLAILLSLLFFLPFVAQADEILTTGTFHGDEVPWRDGDEFLAMVDDCVLVPVKIRIAPERAIGDGEDERTGKSVSVAGYDDLFLMRGRNLHPGKAAPAAPDFAELVPAAWKASFTFNGRGYDFSYRCGKDECTLVVESGDVAQDLVTFPIERRGKEIHTLDVIQVINFAGDLDHDGHLDLIANLSRHWNESRVTLWLSSAAKKGQLLGMTAEHSTVGC